ncbi:MAG: ABC transporter permease subunit [Thermoplasmata archaeon]|nr:ABC transporter permease subunit [Thermoplasmata archaeon]
MSGPAPPAASESPELDEFDAAVARGLAAGRGVRWSRIARQPSLLAGAGILLVFGGIAVYALLRYGSSIAIVPSSIALAQSLNPPGPSPRHPLGVINGIGIDLASSLVRATPFDLALIGGIILLALSAGVLLGAYGGFHGGGVDWLITSAGDVVVGVPPFFLVLVLWIGLHLLVNISQYLLLFGLCFAAVLWPYYARPVRARAQQVAREAYVEASRASGAPDRRLVLHHIIPNSFYPVLAQVPIDVYNVFFVLTVFEFIGCFGNGQAGLFATLTPFPTAIFPEWGYLLGAGACYGYNLLSPFASWWMFTFPAAVIVVFGIGVMLLCDGGEKYLEVKRSG